MRRSKKILGFRAVRRRAVEGRFGDFFVGDRDVETRAKFAQLLFVQFFLLMRDVAAFAGFAQAIAFDGLGQDHRRLAFVFHRGFVGGINFFRIVAAAQQFVDLVVGQMIDHLQQLGIFAKEMFARVAAGLDRIFLIIAIDGFFHALEQQALFIGCEQRIPIGAPDDFDDIPAGAAKERFEFLDDFAVAAHRAVEALQVAVDDPDQVVEIFARGQRERAGSFRFVHFAVADEAPDFRLLARVTVRGFAGSD